MAFRMLDQYRRTLTSFIQDSAAKHIPSKTCMSFQFMLRQRRQVVVNQTKLETRKTRNQS